MFKTCCMREIHILSTLLVCQWKKAETEIKGKRNRICISKSRITYAFCLHVQCNFALSRKDLFNCIYFWNQNTLHLKIIVLYSSTYSRACNTRNYGEEWCLQFCSRGSHFSAFFFGNDNALLQIDVLWTLLRTYLFQTQAFAEMLGKTFAFSFKR